MAETLGSSYVQQWYIYGNYIDEVLAVNYYESFEYMHYLLHDHLFSPAAYLDGAGTVLERYEYDGYGQWWVLGADYTHYDYCFGCSPVALLFHLARRLCG